MIISFAHTTPALLAGRKSVTRRDWAASHAARFKAGMLVDAWNTTPRNVRGNPHKVATIRLTQDAYQESPRDIPEQDFYREGFGYLQSQGLLVDGLAPRDLWAAWKSARPDALLWVVRFELVEVLA